MRVLFDAFWWEEGPHSNRRVQREIILAWAREFPGDELTLAIPAAASPADGFPPEAAVRRLRAKPHGVAVALELPRLARDTGADVMFTHNFTPVRGAAVTFIHDVMFQDHPEWFTPAERMYLAPIPVLARRAAAVLTSSQSEADRIRRRNPKVRSVTPIGLAVSPELASVAPRPPGGAPAQFLLSVGRLNVRKNLAFTLAAAVRSGALSPDRPMVVVGEPDGRGEALGREVDDAIGAGAVVFLGGVDDAELAWLYAHAELFVFLSRGEGFGLPPLEASAFGCPVLAADLPVMREVLHGTGRYADPEDLPAAAAAIAAAAATPPPLLPDDLQPTWQDVVARARAAVVAACW